MESLPMLCSPYLQALLVRAAESLNQEALISGWDEQGRRLLQLLHEGRICVYWTMRSGGRRRHLARSDFMAIAALMNLRDAASGPLWADTEASDAQRLANAIEQGRCAVF